MATITKFLDLEGLRTLWDKTHEVFITKDGDGATGTWDINISGKANTANAANILNPNDELNLTGNSEINFITDNGNGYGSNHRIF